MSEGVRYALAALLYLPAACWVVTRALRLVLPVPPGPTRILRALLLAWVAVMGSALALSVPVIAFYALSDLHAGPQGRQLQTVLVVPMLFGLAYAAWLELRPSSKGEPKCKD